MMSVWQNEGGIRNNMIVKLAFVVGVIFVIVGWGYLESLLLQINYSMFSKIFNITENGSSLTRLESFKVDVYIFANSPIFGVGIDKMETEFLRLRDILCTVTGMAHTSTSTEYMAAFGLGGIWINWLWIKGAISNSKNVLTGVLLIMILAIMLNVAPQINFPLTYFLLFVLLKQDAHEDAVDE